MMVYAQLLTIAVESPEVGALTQGGIAFATIGALVWAVSKIGAVGEKLWNQISTSQAQQMDTTVAALRTILEENRKAEQARTDAQILILKSQIDLLAKTTEGEVAALTQMVRFNQDLREVVHQVRNAATELISAKAMIERQQKKEPE